MSKTFEQRLREDRRLVMLRLLSEQPQFRLNSSNLHAGLDFMAVKATRDDVATDLAWLAEQGLVNTAEAVPGIQVATLTARGAEAAKGAAIIPGVSRPSPK